MSKGIKMRNKWCELMFDGMLFDHSDLSSPVEWKFKGEKSKRCLSLLIFCWSRLTNSKFGFLINSQELKVGKKIFRCRDSSENNLGGLQRPPQNCLLLATSLREKSERTMGLIGKNSIDIHLAGEKHTHRYFKYTLKCHLFLIYIFGRL